ncbi:MAG TPA: hypothetical protein VJ305_11290, partial [Streptosporangiaceae bacterium]|nr:hypothetical protein [Streptosporangiaceae bacterium]
RPGAASPPIGSATPAARTGQIFVRGINAFGGRQTWVQSGGWPLAQCGYRVLHVRRDDGGRSVRLTTKAMKSAVRSCMSRPSSGEKLRRGNITVTRAPRFSASQATSSAAPPDQSVMGG